MPGGGGFTVWWDASLHTGETFDEVIEQRLRDAKAVVVLWSPRSVASRWVRAEATLADRRNKLVPAIIEPCDRPIVFELTHTSDLAGWQGDRSNAEWRTFVDDLDRLVRARRGDDPAPVECPSDACRAAPRGAPAAASRQRPDHRRRPATAARLPTPARAAAGEVHCLEIIEGELPEATIVVDSSSMKLGRSAPAEIVVPHRSISREHCMSASPATNCWSPTSIRPTAPISTACGSAGRRSCPWARFSARPDLASSRRPLERRSETVESRSRSASPPTS